jgi:hypothetical protein
MNVRYGAESSSLTSWGPYLLSSYPLIHLTVHLTVVASNVKVVLNLLNRPFEDPFSSTLSLDLSEVHDHTSSIISTTSITSSPGGLSPSDTSPQPQLNREQKRIYLSLSPMLGVHTNLTGRETADYFKSMKKRNITDAAARGNKRPNLNRTKSGELFDPAPMLEASKEDIVTLWEDETTHRILRMHNVRLRESAGLWVFFVFRSLFFSFLWVLAARDVLMKGCSFLDDVDRICSRDYEPTDEDIIRARVKTIDVEEHHFVCEKGESLSLRVWSSITHRLSSLPASHRLPWSR